MTKFTLMISSDIEYDDLCAEIFYEDEFFGIINQEKGFDNLEIQIHPRKDQKVWSFKYSELIKALQFGKDALEDLPRNEEDKQSD